MHSTASSVRQWQVYTTLLVIGLSVVATGLGLFRSGHYNDPAGIVVVLKGQDIVTLGLVVPLLALGLWYALRGSPAGYVLWLGSLGYMTYTWGSYGVAIYFNDFYLGYIALFGLSLFTFIGAVAQLDPSRIAEAIGDRLPTLVVSAAFVLIGLSMGVMWAAEALGAKLAGDVPEIVHRAETVTSVFPVLDLGIVIPAMIVTAVWLYRGYAWGSVFAGVLLVKFLTMGGALLAMVGMAARDGQSIPASEIGLYVAIAAVGVVLGGIYFRAIARGPTPTTLEGEPTA